eukprot:scaffold180518_cov31-Tisochrysis_lutea.AAC.3
MTVLCRSAQWRVFVAVRGKPCSRLQWRVYLIGAAPKSPADSRLAGDEAFGALWKWRGIVWNAKRLNRQLGRRALVFLFSEAGKERRKWTSGPSGQPG